MKSIREKIEIMQAYERGEQMQIQKSKNIWEDIENPGFDWITCNYRVKPKPPVYPKTYEECCDVLGTTHDYPDIRMGSIDEYFIYTDFITLIRCRNAYWKIAGEQMGLGKPWKPDWSTYNDYKYSLYVTENNVTKGTFNNDNVILAFPTEEMRDAFYENFKEFIEKCKELL